jgi:hypothetical protein
MSNLSTLGLVAVALGTLSACGPYETVDPNDVCRGLYFCTGEPTAGPRHGYVLRGDTIRFTSCYDYAFCGVGFGTGDALAKWTVPNQSVVIILAGDSTPTVVESATSVLLRAVAPGTASVAATLLPTGEAWVGQVTVADSSVITSIAIAPQNAVQFRVRGIKYYNVWLRDGLGRTYRAKPTALSVSNAAVLDARFDGHNIDQSTRLRIYAPNAGTSTLNVSFLGVTSSITITVAP